MARKLDATKSVVNDSVTEAKLASAVKNKLTDAFNQANAAYGQANTARGTANDAYTQANSAYGQANLAYAAANTANLTAGGLISGTLNVTQDLIVGGNVYLEGNTTYINVATYSVDDSLIYLAANNKLTDSVDIGFMGGKNTGGTYAHTGLARDATDGKWKLFDGLADEGHVGNVVDFANTYLATLVANVEANTLTVVNGVAGNVNFDSGTLFVDSVNDRIGIGLTPTVKLDVGADSATPVIFAGAAGGNDIVYTLRQSRGTVVSPSDTGGEGILLSFQKRATSSWASPIAQIYAAGGGSGADGYLAFLTKPSGGSATERARISSGGNFGVGTTNPLSTFVVSNGSNENVEFTGGNATVNGGVLQYINRDTATTRPDMNYYLAAAGNGSHKFYTTDTERMRINASGNVGVGTTSPQRLFDARGAVNLSTTAPSVSPTASSYADIHLRTWSGAANSPARITVIDNWMDFVSTYVDGFRWFNYSADGVVAERMRITSDGNLLVGATTNSLNARLKVAGATRTCTFFDLNAPAGENWVIDSNNTTGSTDVLGIYASGASGLYIKDTGDVGIGTNNPICPLDISKSFSTGSSESGSRIITIQSGNGGSITGLNLTANGQTVGTYGSVLSTGISATINGQFSSSIGINTVLNVTTTSGGTVRDYIGGKFVVNGANSASTASNQTYYGLYAEVNNPGATGETSSIYGVAAIGKGVSTVYGLYASATGGSTNWGVYSNAGNNYFAGNVGIANTAPTAYKLSVTGDIYASNNIIAFSDLRNKTNISNIDNALAKVEAIRGVTYNKIDNPEARFTGVIAQEVLEVLPEAVMGSNETGYAVAYGNMVGLLIEAIKELKKEIDSLKK